MSFSSKLIENAVNAFAGLPGVGRKTALRLALHLVRQTPEVSEQFAEAILKMRHNIKACSVCHNLSDDPVCGICSDQGRDKSVICVVDVVVCPGLTVLPIPLSYKCDGFCGGGGGSG